MKQNIISVKQVHHSKICAPNKDSIVSNPSLFKIKTIFDKKVGKQRKWKEVKEKKQKDFLPLYLVGKKETNKIK